MEGHVRELKTSHLEATMLRLKKEVLAGPASSEGQRSGHFSDQQSGVIRKGKSATESPVHLMLKKLQAKLLVTQNDKKINLKWAKDRNKQFLQRR